jgi:hypothetical protein
MAHKPVLIPIGGFLGAGKTTLILAAARLLRAKGLKAAAIFNDQGSDLVDTLHARTHGVEADQVTGGCFCCLFSQLIEAADRLRATAPDVIFAEAVGSCTDISATTLQPLKLHYSERLRLAPYSVLVDPGRASNLSAEGAGGELGFLFQKQIEEADLLCFTKSDLYSSFPEITGAPVRYLSPLTSVGIDAWLDEVLACEIAPGARVLDIDYVRYAKAEASLAWLNCKLLIDLDVPLSPPALLGPLLDDLDAGLTRAGMRLVHLKLIDTSLSGYLKASIVENGAQPAIEGALDASPASTHELLLNIRASGQPEVLQGVVEAQTSKLPGRKQMQTMQCFSPAEPRPEFRYV